MNERGFTLIELLVVIAILAVLFGLTALALTNVGSDAEQRAAQAEADMVQTAIDVYMTVNNAVTITQVTSPTQVGPGTDPFGDYLRRTSRFYFTWESDGTVNGAYDETNTRLWP